MPRARSRFAGLLIAAIVLAGTFAIATPAKAAPSIVMIREGKPDANLVTRVEKILRDRRSLLPLRPMPPLTQSPEEIANQQRVAAIQQALARAREHEKVANFDACTKEASDKVGFATTLLATTNKLELLRDLHIQIGMCMSMTPTPANAQPHFRTATLLDESPPQKGQHRTQAEDAHEVARAEVLARLRGPVRIETDPAGAEVWIDGRKADGVTPLSVDVRLGTHYITLRRFRFEPDTDAELLQPNSTLTLLMDRAQRATLRQQLAQVDAGRAVDRAELMHARAVFSNAEQIVTVAPATGPTNGSGVTLTLSETTDGKVLRTRTVTASLDDDTLRSEICDFLGEPCQPESTSIFESPWFWVTAGVALVGGAIALGFILDSQRDTVFCPAGGCD